MRIQLLILFTLLCAASAIAQLDTANGIAWGPLIRLSPDSVDSAPVPCVVTQGDTVHITWWNSTLSFPYCRSVDGGVTFQPMRELAPESVGVVQHCILVSAGKRLHAFFLTIQRDSVGNGSMFTYHMYSDDRGDTWSLPHRFPAEHLYRTNGAAWGDTVAFISSGGGSHLTVSSDGGEHWIEQPTVFPGSDMTVAVTSRAIHLVRGWLFDSSGVKSEFVTQYRRSTDLGQTWSDSISLSPLSSQDYDSYVTADPTGGPDSSRIFVTWRDPRNGCLTMVGCSIYGRISNDNGRTFEPERRFDQRAAGFSPAMSGGRQVAMAWVDDYPDWMPSMLVSVSRDNGNSWTPPFPVADSAENYLGGVTMSGNVVHVVVYKLIGSLSDERWHTFYRRGVLLPEQPTLSATMRTGWNLIALPDRLPSPFKSVLFPFSTSGAFTYTGSGYQQDNLLATGKGYWLHFDQYNRSFLFTGTPILPETISVSEGWNMMGCATGASVAATVIRTEPEGILSSPFFSYGGGYQVADTLKPARGYWVRTMQAGRLIVDRTSTVAKTRNASLSASLARLSQLTLTDATCAAQTLYFGTPIGAMDTLMNWSMPPAVPEGGFDCRFSAGTIAEFASVRGGIKEIPIVITSTSYPVTISWDVNTAAPASQLKIGSYAITMTGKGTAHVDKPGCPVVLQLGGAIPAVPKTFALYQNYPNPFNPVTRIRFDVPVAGNVELKVFDVFGREVATLINKELLADEHDVEWNASRYASGVYFYRMKWQGPAGETKILTGKALMVK